MTNLEIIKKQVREELEKEYIFKPRSVNEKFKLINDYKEKFNKNDIGYFAKIYEAIRNITVLKFGYRIYSEVPKRLEKEVLKEICRQLDIYIEERLKIKNENAKR